MLDTFPARVPTVHALANRPGFFTFALTSANNFSRSELAFNLAAVSFSSSSESAKTALHGLELQELLKKPLICLPRARRSSAASTSTAARVGWAGIVVRRRKVVVDAAVHCCGVGGAFRSAFRLYASALRRRQDCPLSS